MFTLEPEDAYSFSDSRRSPSDPDIPEREVAINGQMIRGDCLEWYGELRSEFSEVKGELKYSIVEKRFRSLRRDAQRRIRAGVRKVRIHIVDSLAYQARENQIYRRLLQTDANIRMIHARAREGNQPAKEFLRRREQRIAHDILHTMGLALGTTATEFGAGPTVRIRTVRSTRFRNEGRRAHRPTALHER
jgi:hypothetical protein